VERSSSEVWIVRDLEREDLSLEDFDIGKLGKGYIT